MKNYCAVGGLLVCLLTTTITFAQQAEPQFRQVAPSKPGLFARFTSRTECNAKEINKLCAARIADAVSIQLSNDLTLTGEVTDRVQQTTVATTINLRLTNYEGALLNLTLLTQPDNTTKVSGRIIHPESGDILILTQENNKFYLTKESRKFLMTE
ncbi:MAG: hypothetical protein QM731_16610 [Chitinophagaceae bacterium]